MNTKRLILFDLNKKTIFDGRITSLNLAEEIIIKKSIEYFNDPSPCFIHRSAVMKKLFIEFEDFLESGIKTGINEWSWKDLPDDIRNILSSYNDISDIRYII